MDSAAADRHDAPMTTPRRLLVDPVNACDYHLVSRCVQGAFLCGRDPRTGRDYSHRRQWLVDRINLLACCFAVEVYAYCIMSNHFHLVARYDPLARWRWSDEEVARRWVDAFPPTEKGEVLEQRKPEARELLLGDPERLFRARCTLGSLSDFMKHLRIKRPNLARRALLTLCYVFLFSPDSPEATAARPGSFTTFFQHFLVAFQLRNRVNSQGAVRNRHCQPMHGPLRLPARHCGNSGGGLDALARGDPAVLRLPLAAVYSASAATVACFCLLRPTTTAPGDGPGLSVEY